MDNVVEKFKKGNKIHIKESQKGSFTKWCGGNVTSECIQRGKNSSNPKIRKKATFAANARKWKHRFGGIIKAQEGTIINNSPIVTQHLQWLQSIPEYLDYKKKIEEQKKLQELQEAQQKQDMLGSILGTAGNFLLSQLASKNFKNENSSITNNSSSNNSSSNNTIQPNLIYDKPSQFKGYLSSFSS